MLRRSKFVQNIEKENGGARSERVNVNQSGNGDSAAFEFNTAVYEYVNADTTAGKRIIRLEAVLGFTPSIPTKMDELHANRANPKNPIMNRAGDMCLMSIVTVIKNITRTVARVRMKRTRNHVDQYTIGLRPCMNSP